MNCFTDMVDMIDWEDMNQEIQGKSALDVQNALSAPHCTIEDLAALLSPAAEPFLEPLAQRAHQITIQRFGRVIQMYAPLYISSECTNACVYCGFNHNNKIARATLTIDEVVQEAQALLDQGFKHILLVTGESPKHVSVDYLSQIAARLHPTFASISIEVYPMGTDDYKQLIENGVDGLTIYQETYHRGCYSKVHPKGKKSNYNYRLETPDRGGKAGFRKINIGALQGLSDWRVEGYYLAMHARYLMKTYWKSHVSVSFPRLRPAAGGYQPQYPLSDRHMVQLMCALRLFLPDAGLVVSTRESQELRDHLLLLGVTQMSAGSKTAPGGYSVKTDNEGQFEISDHRTPEQVAEMISKSGYEPVWKDWDQAFLDTHCA